MNIPAYPFDLPSTSQSVNEGRADLPAHVPNVPLGQILLDLGHLQSGDLLKATAMRGRQHIRIGEILVSNGFVTEAQLYDALAIQYECAIADLSAEPPGPTVAQSVPAETCLKHGLIPWKRFGPRIVVATDNPGRFREDLHHLPPEFSDALMAVAPRWQIEDAVMHLHASEMVATAEECAPAQMSSREFSSAAAQRYGLALVIAFAAALLAFPAQLLIAAILVALTALGLMTILRIAAMAALWRSPLGKALSFTSQRGQKKRRSTLPRVSILVPLYREKAIAGRLVRRLSRINYPRELLDIVLVVEEMDLETRYALSHCHLPPYFRTVRVPDGALKTKPRALNFALSFCRGDIVGVIDAEDAPEPDQVFRVTRRFAEAPVDVACLQGVLDFYNARKNWLSRCFSIEYASWFRVMLPGIERLGLAVPLGGTTLYFRRAVLEEIGRWDAHNVTEDADLGIRLARFGYRTELFGTRTDEEANCRLVPWIRQRSRWLKGYAMTWAAHMRRPLALLRDLGLRKFIGFQLLFLCTLVQFLLAPVLWSLWIIPFGLTHPIQALLPNPAVIAMFGVMITAEVVGLALALFATRGKSHRWLWPWIPTMHLYFPLASVAILRALWEIVRRPFYWDKTEHGAADRPASGLAALTALITQNLRRS